MPKGIFVRIPKTHCIHGHEYTPENVYLNPKTGVRSCRTCYRLGSATFRDRHPDRMAAKRIKSQNGKLYGPDYNRDAQLASQGGACAICGRTDCTWKMGFTNAWHTDHKHGLEGTHRGVLCGNCNTALGKLEPYWEKATAYLTKYAAEQRASTEGCDIECSGQERLSHEKDFEHPPVGHSSVDDSITPL